MCCAGLAREHRTYFCRPLRIKLRTYHTKNRMARFHSLTVAKVTKEAGECIVVDLEVPEAVKEEFRFTHGQYLTLKLSVKGEELRRSYSICSSPLDPGHISIAVKKVKGGRASTQLVEELRPGQAVAAMTPMGNFSTQLGPTQAHHYVAFAAGSGITPILSILITALRTEPGSRFTLFYGNTDTDRIIFRKRLQDLRVRFADRLEVHHILSQGKDEDMLFNGRITKEKARELVERFVTDGLHKEFFICGPEQMMVNVSEALEGLGVPRKHIHIELFTSPVTEKAERGQGALPANGLAGKAEVTLVLDGREHRLKLGASDIPVLDAAINAGLDVPYACKGAVCCTCKARVVAGTVTMEMNYALTDEEVADGYVLTCQAHPSSPSVTIDYDQH
jgi:ring-1,2-phenylacetyl-CoA epoxidase subunit PaaE